jgi:hypothetical protein
MEGEERGRRWRKIRGDEEKGRRWSKKLPERKTLLEKTREEGRGEMKRGEEEEVI